MKKYYIQPKSEVLNTISYDVMKVAQPSAGNVLNPHGATAPARRITVLGSIGGGAGIGSLGSIGYIK